MKFSILPRSLGNDLAPAQLNYQVERYSHAAIGGPKLAQINVTGDELAIWEIIDYLRSPVSIHSDLGDCVWWGYVAEVAVTIGALEISVTIDSMRNRVATAYQDEATKARATTSWVSDSDSVTEYGTREMLYAISETDLAAAEGARNAILSQLRYPIPGISVKGQTAGENVPVSGVLLCRGWWDTLDWKYYSNAGVAVVDAAAQVEAILTAGGQFLSSIGQEVTAGISTAETRSGDQSARVEVEELLTMGTSNSRRMLVTVDVNRRALIFEEPSSGNAWFVERSGRIYDAYGSELRSELCPVGNYLRMRDIVPNSANLARLADPAVIFIEEAEYTPADGKLKITPRGVPSIYDLGRAGNG